MPSPKSLPPAPASRSWLPRGVLVVEQVEDVGEQLQPVAGEAVVVEQPDVDDSVGRVAERADRRRREPAPRDAGEVEFVARLDPHRQVAARRAERAAGDCAGVPAPVAADLEALVPRCTTS